METKKTQTKPKTNKTKTSKKTQEDPSVVKKEEINYFQDYEIKIDWLNTVTVRFTKNLLQINSEGYSLERITIVRPNYWSTGQKILLFLSIVLLSLQTVLLFNNFGSAESFKNLGYSQQVIDNLSSGFYIGRGLTFLLIAVLFYYGLPRKGVWFGFTNNPDLGFRISPLANKDSREEVRLVNLKILEIMDNQS